MDRNIKTAVEFLDDVFGKQHDEAALRKYLLLKQNLSHEQVDEAFNIHRSRIDKASIDERQEVKVAVLDKKGLSYALCLEANKRDAGQRLINKFIESELKYCNLLGSLWSDYCVKLIDMAFRQKIQMCPQKSKKLFQHIPHLLKFHNAFQKGLNTESDIGRLFVRSVSFFEGYIEYTKSIKSVIKQLGEYTGDEALQIYLSNISKRSKCSPSDLVGLLIVPLDRMQEYKRFLYELREFADKTTRAYKYLDKAARRVNRLALHVNMFRSKINNLYEIYRIQVYLSGKVNILVDERRLIRRGIITGRTGGWTARNKQWVLFLFNDILLYSSQKGVFQNILPLHSCKVLPHEGGNNSEKKFMVVSERKDTTKILLLECETWKQRNAWCVCLTEAIKRCKKLGLKQVIQLPLTLNSVEKADSQKLNENSWVPLIKVNDNVISESFEYTPVLQSEDSREDPDIQVDYDWEHSRNYTISEFKGWEPCQEISSLYSESELDEKITLRDRSTKDVFNTHVRIPHWMRVHSKEKSVGNSSPKLPFETSNDGGVSAVDTQSTSNIDIEELTPARVDYSHSTSSVHRNFTKSCAIRRDKKYERNVTALVPGITISLNNILGD